MSLSNEQMNQRHHPLQFFFYTGSLRNLIFARDCGLNASKLQTKLQAMTGNTCSPLCYVQAKRIFLLIELFIYFVYVFDLCLGEFRKGGKKLFMYCGYEKLSFAYDRAKETPCHWGIGYE